MANDTGMRRALAAFVAAFPLLAATSASATSIATAPKHDPRQGCAAIRQVVANLNSGDLMDGVPFPGPMFYTDALGLVDPEEDDKFLQAMRHSEGKPDRVPIGLAQVFSVHRGKYEAVYLVVLVRQAWHEEQQVHDELTMSEDVIPAGYQVDRSHWLVTFRSNYIEHFREAPEMFELGAKRRELKKCPEKRWP
jgi:hypothetical protein